MFAKRRIVPLAAAVLLLTATTPGAAEAPREVKGRYEIGEEVLIGGPAFVGGGATTKRYRFPIGKGERSVHVRVVDEREGRVAGHVAQFEKVFDAGDGTLTQWRSVTFVEFCGETDARVSLKPKLPVEVGLYRGTCDDGTPSLPTSGWINLRLFKGR